MILTPETFKNKKVVIVPWSGGVDSTAVLLGVIDYFLRNQDATKGIRIHVVIARNKHTIAGRMEHKARKKILKYIKKNHNWIMSRLDKRVTLHDGQGQYFKNGGGTQQFWWLNMVHSKFGSNFVILFGHIKGDCFWTVFDKFQRVVAANDAFYCGETNRDIEYPLMDSYKDEVFKSLPKKVRKLVWYCAYPTRKKKKPCGTCDSCIVHNKFCK